MLAAQQSVELVCVSSATFSCGPSYLGHLRVKVGHEQHIHTAEPDNCAEQTLINIQWIFCSTYMEVQDETLVCEL